MRFRGGYNIKLQGEPSGTLKPVPCPDILYYPLKSKSFHYSQMCVTHGQEVALGDVLAKDPDNYDVPLLSSCAGKVDLEMTPGHVTLTELSSEGVDEYSYQDELEHIHKKMGSAGLKRYKLLNLGAWEYIQDAYTGRTTDPLSTPEAIIVSTVRFEPFLVKGSILLSEYLLQFTRGLEHLQSLLEYQPIYLVLPKVKSDLAVKIKEQIRGYAWVKVIEVPLKYPYGDFTLLARHLGLKKGQEGIWGVNVDGVLAIDNVLTSSRPCVDRFISVAGPGVSESGYLKLRAGYPLSQILSDYAQADTIAIDGGILTGRVLTEDVMGVPSDCKGITLLPEHLSREFLGFARPGFDRQSYSECFLSSLCGQFPERLTNALWGELRPCVSCNFCGDVCPAGIIPHRLHKLIYQDDIDEIERSRIDLCVECGLCSYVCPSKIELMHQFKQAKQAILQEKAATAAEAAAEEQTNSE
ncbi:MAG: 4Fe-4S dicluster domain-containing protein [Planctomycetota bacterium]